MVMRDARQRMMNAAFEVMELAGGRKVKARGLGMFAAVDWCMRAEGLEKALNLAKGNVEATRSALWDITEHVAGYEAEWPRDVIVEQASVSQVLDAFYLLWRENDPFATAERNQVEALEKQLGIIEKAGGAAALMGPMGKTVGAS